MNVNKIGDKAIDNNFQKNKEVSQDDEFEKRLLSAYENKDEKALKEVCREFEGLLLNMVYKQMRATVPKSDLIPQDAGREIFESMLDDELVKEASNNRSYGLAEDLYRQLSGNIKAKEVYFDK
ncbi:rod-binding protein [Herbivorax sp. ANBcel31]|uniref:rod-binding protein n=1 Tax=Herbivorax sp. ANBcel31 TaxID=3069754 RepID=UPI0027B637C1|nr:rod-binding protein [Herbivorax sp. ANBcel31]MDQ2086515.1 rod-binding protein [Herbivorax sp. ANBcel31]